MELVLYKVNTKNVLYSIEFEYEVQLNYQAIKQWFLTEIKGVPESIRGEAKDSFNNNDWVVVNCENSLLYQPEPKMQEQVATTETPQSSLMTKIEQLQQSQSTIKSLNLEIARETEEVANRISAIESKQEQVEELRTQQRILSAELVELQQLLNELLTERDEI
jgi:predicted RNase H-like nuclease (RuvC/YqgF family)